MTRRLRLSLVVFVLAFTASFTATVLIAQRRVPLASEADLALAPLLVSTDGSTVTFRTMAKAALRICVEADETSYTRRTCFTVGDVRTGRVGMR